MRGWASLARPWIVGPAAAWAVWAGVFIQRASFLAVDGQRHRCLFDDAMVSLRYGWNLAHGNGLVWNPGQRVEGITNLLTTLTMALWSLPGDKDLAVLLAQVFGALCVAASALAAVAVWRELHRGADGAPRPAHELAVMACVLFYYPLAFWSLMGMETGLLTALLTIATWLTLRLDGTPRASGLLAAVLALAWLARPDALVPAALLLAARALSLRRARASMTPAALEALVLLACCAVVTALRWAYYGTVVPNTYTLKLAHFPLGSRLVNALGFLRGFWPSAAAALALALFHLSRRRDPRSALLALLVAAALAYQVYVGGDGWLYWRMLAPVMPLLFVLALSGARTLAGRRPALFPLLALLVMLGANGAFLGELTFMERAYSVNDNRHSVNQALAVKAVTREEATVGVVWAGSVPFFSDRRGIDFLGKNDAYIASLPPDLTGVIGWHGMFSVPGHNKYDLAYSIGRLRPTYVQRATWGWDNLEAFVAAHYRAVDYRGVRLLLRRDDPAVLWDRLDAPSLPPR